MYYREYECESEEEQQLLSEYSRKVTRRNVAKGTATLPELKHDYLVDPVRKLIWKRLIGARIIKNIENATKKN